MFSAFRAGRIGPVLCLIGAAFVASPALAQDTGGASPGVNVKPESTSSAPPAARSAALAALFKRYGVELEVDPESGRLQTPSAEQLAALRETLEPLMKAPAIPPAPKYHPNGMISNVLGIWNFGASYAFLDPEAGLQTRCVGKLQELAVPVSAETTKKDVE